MKTTVSSFSKANSRCLGAVLVFLSFSLQAAYGQGVTTSTENPLQTAIVHWYVANQAASFSVGRSPVGVAFDGANIWVASGRDNTVTKLRASDGFTLGTFAVGT